VRKKSLPMDPDKVNYSISSGTILKQGFNCKIPNLSFKGRVKGKNISLYSIKIMYGKSP